jgi:protein-tyrosine phosphatase
MTTAIDRFANARDVGGLSTADGRTVRPGVLYRSDAPLPGDVVDQFVIWPPATVIDLRSEGEHPGEHPLLGEDIDLHTLPLIANLNPMRFAAQPASTSLGVLYRHMLDGCGPSFARIAQLVATSSGPTLLHCAGGKDRTGVAVAVLLDAVGVQRREIVADYRRTEPHVPDILNRMAAAAPADEKEAVRAQLGKAPTALLGAPGDAIEGVLDFLALQPGGSAGWLGTQGLEPDTITQLRGRLLTDQ